MRGLRRFGVVSLRRRWRARGSPVVAGYSDRGGGDRGDSFVCAESERGMLEDRPSAWASARERERGGVGETSGK